MSHTEYQELCEVVESKAEFQSFLIDLLKTTKSKVDYSEDDIGTPLVGYGSNDGYYWDTTYVELNTDGETLTVTFDIGSGSGCISTDFTEYEVTIEQFRQYLLNRKWADKNIDTIQLLLNSVEDIEGSRITEERHDD